MGSHADDGRAGVDVVEDRDVVDGWSGVERALAYVDLTLDTLIDFDAGRPALAHAGADVRPRDDDVTSCTRQLTDDVMTGDVTASAADEETRRCISDACHLL